MVDAALIVEWGMPMSGRETKALEAFAMHMRWWEELKAQRRIDSFRPYGLTTGTLGPRTGFVVIEGTTQQIDALRHSDDFRANLNTVFTCVNDVGVYTAETGPAMLQRMERYGKAVKQTVG